MFINTKQVKMFLKENNKQCGTDYIEALNGKVKELLTKSIANAQHFKRLHANELA